MAEFPLHRMIATEIEYRVDPPMMEATGYETRYLNDPERPADEVVQVPLITDEAPVLWKGAL